MSWGNGLVFQPMDLFNPFTPTAVDRDYKPGNDLLLVEMRYFEQRPFKEVAEIMGITENNAKVKLYRALDRLKKTVNAA